MTMLCMIRVKTIKVGADVGATVGTGEAIQVGVRVGVG